MRRSDERSDGCVRIQRSSSAAIYRWSHLLVYTKTWYWRRGSSLRSSGFQSTATHSSVSVGVVCRGRRSSTTCHRRVSHTGDVTFSVRGSIPGSGGTSTSGHQASQRRNVRAVYKDKSLTTSGRSSRYLVFWVRFYLCLFHFSVVSRLEIA